MRGVPDIAYQASARTGPLVYNQEEGGWFTVGGTSCSSPQWAGIAAMANQMAGHDLGFLNPALYANPAALTDITEGINGAHQTQGYKAGKGWDPCTGLGVPNGEAIAAVLIP